MASIPPYISQSGRHADTQQESKSATTKNLDAAPAHKWRPIRPRFSIWTPRQHPTGVQSAIHLQSGRRDYSRWASKSLYKRNLDATSTPNRRPIRHTSPIWTPRQHPKGVQISNHQESGRRDYSRWASKSLYKRNLDAAPTAHWRPIRPRSSIWTPRQHPTGVHSALDSQFGRRPVRKWRPFRPRFSIWTPR